MVHEKATGPRRDCVGPRAVDQLGSDIDRKLTEFASNRQVILRDYQESGVAQIRQKFRSGAGRVLFQSPTGAGKTVVFGYIVQGAVARGGRVLIVVHRIELLDQIAAALDRFGVPYGLIAAGVPETDAPAQIAMVGALLRRLDRWRGWATFIVLDECHHAVAASWSTVVASQPDAKLLGVTATPERLDGKGLGEVFESLVIGPSTAELIAAGWLSPYVAYAPCEGLDLSNVRTRGGEFDTSDVKTAMASVASPASAAREFQRLCPRARAIGFAPDIADSQAYATAFTAAGIPAAHVDSETPGAERSAAIAGLAKGSIRVIFNVALFAEGVDVPAIESVILLRPTASLAVHLQQIGRALRPAPEKDRAVILDFSGNCGRHGLPDAPRTWSLDSKPRRQRGRSESLSLRKCGSCATLNPAGAHECSECGADLRTAKERREIEMRLEEARRDEEEDRLALMRPCERIAWAGFDEHRLRLVARVSRYAPGWIFHRLREARERMGARS